MGEINESNICSKFGISITTPVDVCCLSGLKTAFIIEIENKYADSEYATFESIISLHGWVQFLNGLEIYV